MLDAIFNPLRLVAHYLNRKKDNISQNTLTLLKKTLNQKLLYAKNGLFDSRQKGSGLSFSEIREYNIGDDIRKIDWNIFARTLVPHVREYFEEKQQTVWLVIDDTDSMSFGKNVTKKQTMYSLIYIWCLLARKTDSRIGAIVFREKGFLVIEPSSNKNQETKILNYKKLYPYFKQYRGECFEDIKNILQHKVGRNQIIIMLSDFIFSYDFSRWKYLSKKTKILSCHIYDDIELSLINDVGIMHLKDPESDSIITIDTSDKKVMTKIIENNKLHFLKISKQLQKVGKYCNFSTSEQTHSLLGKLIK